MKTKNYWLDIVRATILSIALLFAGGLHAQSKDRSPAIPKDNAAIQMDVNTVNTQTAKVDDLKKRYKDDLQANRKETAIADKKELSKARAVLKKDRSFMAADVRDVRSDNRLAIRNSKKAIRDDRSDLAKARKDLRDSRKRADEATVRIGEAKVKMYERILDSDKARLKLEKDKRSYDRVFLKTELKRLKSSHEWLYFANL